MDIPPSPLSENMVDRDQKLWDTIRDLCVSSLQSRTPQRTSSSRLTIFPQHTKKTAQNSVNPFNFLENLAYTVDKRFVLAYPSQVVNTDGQIFFPLEKNS
ncbi:hypothetical protein DSO57_1012410 [Entomophthora muscae]|uniref:Uncharacterized protein n=1 Tax=Entomophthora muscae TaxID=34485 RepID=A0ACC2UT14_9FUNG|nr:hypothetical protein DSO57_1012410 [Entomophthora muscae]